MIFRTDRFTDVVAVSIRPLFHSFCWPLQSKVKTQNRLTLSFNSMVMISNWNSCCQSRCSQSPGNVSPAWGRPCATVPFVHWVAPQNGRRPLCTQTLCNFFTTGILSNSDDLYASLPSELMIFVLMSFWKICSDHFQVLRIRERGCLLQYTTTTPSINIFFMFSLAFK
jgi:hypothetical protein